MGALFNFIIGLEATPDTEDARRVTKQSQGLSFFLFHKMKRVMMLYGVPVVSTTVLLGSTNQSITGSRGQHLTSVTFLTDHVITGTASCSRMETHSHSTPQTTRTMNSLYTLGVRQSSSIQADLERLRGGDTSASLLGLSPPLTCSLLVTAHSGMLYPARADICFARRDEPHDR